MSIQDQLNNLYSEYLSSASVEPNLASRLVCPFLLAVGPDWERTTRRLLIVGQETRSDWKWRPVGHPNRPDHERCPWDHAPLESLADVYQYEHSVQALVSGYDWAFHGLAREDQLPRSSPFWRAFHHLRTSTGYRILWTNLFRCACESGSIIRAVQRGKLAPGDLKSILKFQRGLLGRETCILKPKAVVFFTGPTADYENELQSEFPRREFVPIQGYDPRELARVVDVALPALSFRTYHPAALRRHHKWDFLDEIAAALNTEPA